MELDELRRSLAYFHMLEVNQVNLYNAQAALADTEMDRRMFKKISEIEAGHIDNIREALLSIGGSPTLLSSVAPLAGTGLGTVTGLTLTMALKSNIAIENKAMADYMHLISRCDDERILEVLLSNCLDESLHTEWFKARLADDVDKIQELASPKGP